MLRLLNHFCFILFIAVVGCASVPDENPALAQAQREHSALLNDPQATKYAALEVKKAGDVLAQAENAWRAGEDVAQVNHLAYLSSSYTNLAKETARLKMNEERIAAAGQERDKVRLEARTREAETKSYEAAQAQQSAQYARQQAELSRNQAMQAQESAQNAATREQRLRQQLEELQAKQTERGIVMTLGDVLFDTGRAELKSGAMRSLEKLVAFLDEYPTRKLIVEGFTDSVGGESYNQRLSERRANAVVAALTNLGLDESRIQARGYGEDYPVASNKTASGRQLNRRVEIVISDENGRVSTRTRHQRLAAGG